MENKYILQNHIYIKNISLFFLHIPLQQQSKSGIGDHCILRVGAHLAADLSDLGNMQSVS